MPTCGLSVWRGFPTARRLHTRQPRGEPREVPRSPTCTRRRTGLPSANAGDPRPCLRASTGSSRTIQWVSMGGTPGLSFMSPKHSEVESLTPKVTVPVGGPRGRDECPRERGPEGPVHRAGMQREMGGQPRGGGSSQDPGLALTAPGASRINGRCSRAAPSLLPCQSSQKGRGHLETPVVTLGGVGGGGTGLEPPARSRGKLVVLQGTGQPPQKPTQRQTSVGPCGETRPQRWPLCRPPCGPGVALGSSVRLLTEEVLS